MKIVLINGSPKGKQSSSTVMLSAFVNDIKDTCEIVTVNLAEKNVHYCQGCYSCWSNHEGCVVDDDFADIIKSAANTDLIVFASPVYFGNVTGLFKNFIDRLTSTGNPHTKVKIGAPKFIMMSNCGFSDDKEFEIISLWINKFVKSMRSELLGEFYFQNGRTLKDLSDAAAQKYLAELSIKGREIVKSLS